MTTLIIDGANFIHRSEGGWQGGDVPIVFNFFRSLRALVEQFNPQRVIFVLEGHPKKRHDAFAEYKANRKILIVEGVKPDEKTQKRIDQRARYFRQSDLIISLLQEAFPISVVRHPDHECDDVIYNLIKRASSAVDFTVVSNDTDFTQLLCEFDNVCIYNPMLKEFVAKPDVDYVTWKALRGDGSDNIPGIPGIGDKTADELMSDPDKLALLFEDKAKADIFERNYNLIKFDTWTNEDADLMTSSIPKLDKDRIQEAFKGWEFNSILKEKSWDKYVATFAKLT